MYNIFNMTKQLCIKPQNDCVVALSNADVLVSTLVELGISCVFGYPGASVLSVYNALSQTNQIKHYLVRHEQASVHAAEGYARISGKAGVVLVTSGPGFTNTITGIANAYADSTPLIVLAGDVATNNQNDKVFQKVDIKELVKTCSKKTYVLSEHDDVNAVLKEAYNTAMTGKKGPVILVLPRNIIEAPYKKLGMLLKTQPDAVKNFDSKVEEFSKLIKQAKSPLLLIGGGCVDAEREIESFVSKLQIPVVSTLMGIGAYPSENNLYLGMIGLNGVPVANAAIEQCDLLISLGVSFSDRTTCKNLGFKKNFKIVNVNIEKSGHAFPLEIQSDVKTFLQNFLEQEWNIEPKQRWLMAIEEMKEDFFVNEKVSENLHSSFVLDIISEFTRYYEPVVVTDVGQHQMLTAQFFKFNKPRKFITSGGMGTMGFGLPASVGAQIASPDSLVLNITGDGSFQMNLQELATCREHNIPVKIIIMNNSYLGMVRQMQEKIYNKRYQVEMINPDFTKIAEAYDLFAVRVRNKEELIPALEKAIKHNGTAIVDVVIDSFENI